MERTFAWLCQSRRFSRDYERLCSTSEALIYAAMVASWCGVGQILSFQTVFRLEVVCAPNLSASDGRSDEGFVLPVTDFESVTSGG